ncbi:MAG: hypothetical protein JWM31_955, partial [Solirubrobacterales bacterium]|nr:hypothetical protein [Solirubrobacterales bacterium]
MPSLAHLAPRTLLVTAALAVAALVGAAPGQAADCAGTDVRPTSAATVAAAQDATLCLLNRERAAAGLGALRVQPELTRVATDYSAAMVQQSVFAHVLPGGP